VPQFLAFGGRYYLIFCTSAERTSALRTSTLSREGRQPETGTHYFMADRPQGPWRLGPLPFLSASAGPLYAGRVVRDPAGNHQFLGFMGTDARGVFRGAISDPIPIAVDDDGTLKLRSPPGSEQSPFTPHTGMAATGTSEAEPQQA
jgi:beta-fructofuranosidase